MTPKQSQDVTFPRRAGRGGGGKAEKEDHRETRQSRVSISTPIPSRASLVALTIALILFARLLTRLVILATAAASRINTINTLFARHTPTTIHPNVA